MRRSFRQLWYIITAPIILVDSFVLFVYRILKRFFEGAKEFFGEDPQDAPIADVIQVAVEDPAEILLHLDALRKHLIRAVSGLLIACILAFLFIRPVLDWLTVPIPGGLDSLVAIDVTEPLGVVMKVVLLIGFTLSLPYMAFEALLFAAPGLSRRARILGLTAIPLTFLFFLGGLLFAYYFMLPPAIDFLINFMGIETDPRPSSYISLITGIMFWIGIAFETPLLALVLSSMGVLQAEWLVRYWRIAVIIMSVLAAAITPTIDPLNMMLVLGPLIFLYILSIGFAYIGQGRRQAARNRV
jgi:sec-independent protein translocase protein TatC